MSIIDNMVKIMEIKGIKPIDLCNALHVSSSTVANWKGRGTDPPAKYIIPICELLGVSPYLLLTGIEKEMPCETVTIGNQSPTITNSNHVEVNGIKHTSSTDSLPETTEELIRIYDQLPLKEKIRLMNLIYDYVEKYQHDSTE